MRMGSRGERKRRRRKRHVAPGIEPTRLYPILAIDPGLTTGFAIATSMDEIPASHAWEQSMLVDHAYEYVVDYHRLVFTRLFEYVSDVFSRERPKTLILEQPFIARDMATAGVLLHGYRAVLLVLTCLPGSSVNIVDEIPPKEWQSWAVKEGWEKRRGKGGNAHDAAWLAAYAARLFEE